jgi:hypothetical protein
MRKKYIKQVIILIGLSQGLELVSQGLEFEKNITMSFPSHRTIGMIIVDRIRIRPNVTPFIGYQYHGHRNATVAQTTWQDQEG